MTGPLVGLTKQTQEPQRVSWQTNTDALMAWHRYQKTRLSPITLAGYRYEVARFLRAWNTPAWDLERRDLWHYIERFAGLCCHYRNPSNPAQQGCSKSCDLFQCSTQCPAYEAMQYGTVSRHLQAIVGFYDYLEHVGAKEPNPARIVKKEWLRENRHRKRAHIRRLPTRQEIQALMGHQIAPNHRALYLVMAKTGVRISEALRLQIDAKHFQPYQGWMVIPDYYGKRRGNRYLVIDDELQDHLTAYLQWRTLTLQRSGRTDHQRLFIGQSGMPLGSTSNAHKTIHRLMREDTQRVGLWAPDHDPITAHCFRHYFSDALKKKGCPDYWWNVLRGDIPKGNLATYVHPTHQDLHEQYRQYAPRVMT